MKIIKELMFIIILSALISCASSKSVQRVDGPEDYYESESGTSTTQVGSSEKSDTKSEERQDLSKSTEQKSKAQSNQLMQNKTEGMPKAESKQDNTVPFKIEESPLPQNVQDELSDDNWAKDEGKVKLRKKDKDKVKDSPLDDDKWGKN